MSNPGSHFVCLVVMASWFFLSLAGQKIRRFVCPEMWINFFVNGRSKSGVIPIKDQAKRLKAKVNELSCSCYA